MKYDGQYDSSFLIRAFVVGVVGFSVLSPVFRLEWWPFSSYQMFSGDFRKSPSVMHIKAYAQNGEVVDLNTKSQFLYPVGKDLIKNLLWQILRADSSFERTKRAQAYERKRLRGAHDGPVIHRIVLDFESHDFKGQVEVNL